MSFVQSAASKAVAVAFRAIVEQQSVLNATMINLEDIELKSAGAIATALSHALERKGFFTQEVTTIPGTDKEVYTYKASNINFNKKSIGVLAVQLSGVLPYLDQEYNFDHVAETAVFRRRFRDIARANQKVAPEMFNQLMDTTEHWHQKLILALELAIDAGLVDMREEDGVRYIKHSIRYLGSCISRTGIMHQTQEINVDNRRKERVKTRRNARKDGTSAEVREALSFIESQGQVVNTWLLDAIELFTARCAEMNLPVPAVFNESRHVIFGCRELRNAEVLHSEYFMDLRGRMYQFAHCGPNPQASDMSKALCYHNVANTVAKGSAQYDIFINELFGEVIGNTDSVWAQPKTMRRVAEDPVAAMFYAFNTTGGDLPFKKFFSYLDMCKTWVEFEDTGFGDSRLGFGPDAKCSGAQIFAILAGCERMAKACGLITGFDKKPADPYQMSAIEVAQLSSTAAMALKPNRDLTRNEIKTPFMAIQYGGGVPALRFKKFEPVLDKIGIAEDKRNTFCKDVVIKGINNAMGKTIENFQDALREAVANYCDLHNVNSFEYRHIDGFLVTKTGEADVMMSEEAFIVNYGAKGQGVIFGSLGRDDGQGGKVENTGNGWFIESRTQGTLQRQNFVHYFPVHFIQGLDAVMARKIALGAKKLGLRGYSTIHDQFRVCLEDAPRLRAEVIPAVYKDMFIDNDPVAHLAKQMGMDICWYNPLEGRKSVISEEILYSNDAYYFE